MLKRNSKKNSGSGPLKPENLMQLIKASSKLDDFRLRQILRFLGLHVNNFFEHFDLETRTEFAKLSLDLLSERDLSFGFYWNVPACFWS